MTSRVWFDSVDSSTDLTFTYHESKLSCWKPMYAAHMTFAYLVMITGLLCFITRLWPKLYFLHIWFGRFYIMFMLWCTSTAMLIHNTGLPVGVLLSFILVSGGLNVGWIAITLHTKHRHLFKWMKMDSSKDNSRWRIILDRLLSLKTLHGCAMFVSWVNIAGRIFVTPVDGKFECYTYPVFKPVGGSIHYTYNASQPLVLVPQIDSKYNRLPWAYKEDSWMAMLCFGPLFGGLFIAFIYLLITVKVKHVQPSSTQEKGKEPEQEIA